MSDFSMSDFSVNASLGPDFYNDVRREGMSNLSVVKLRAIYNGVLEHDGNSKEPLTPLSLPL